MEQKKLTCIGCPMGCEITVGLDCGKIISVAGNTCPRGDVYARKEVTSPTRTLTSLVRLKGGKDAVVSVKTETDIPKDKIFDCIRALKEIEVCAPVHIGDVILKNAADTGVNVIVTREETAQSCLRTEF